MKITTVLVVESVERSLEFWVGRMGFAETVEVPEGDKVGFAILEKGGAEVMLQSASGVEKEDPKFSLIGTSAMLFVEVDDWADTKKRLEGHPIAKAEHVTFYGMREIGVFEPGGHLVVFAAKA